MLVVEFRTDSPMLRGACEYAPDATVVYEELYRTADGVIFLFWAEGSDLAAFDAGLEADPTVTDVRQLADSRNRCLYRARFTDRGEQVATFPSWSELDISLLDARGMAEGWDVRMRLPDRDALDQYRALCETKGLQFSLQSIYEEHEAASTADVQLSSAQRETLRTARDLGYFEIPRQATLAEVATHNGISSQAASARLRRGMATLIDQAL